MNHHSGRVSLSTDKTRCNCHCAYTRTHTPRLMVWNRWVPNQTVSHIAAHRYITRAFCQRTFYGM